MKPNKTAYPHLAPTWARMFAFLASASLIPAGLSAQEVSSVSADKEEIIELSPFTVDGSADAGYYSNQTLAGGRLRTQLSDVATSVQVMTAEFLDDVGATSLDEALLYATNADVAGRGSNFNAVETSSTLEIDNSSAREVPGDANRIRGLGKATRTVDYFQTDIPFDSYISGRVDVNRGANSFLFGLGSPGGIVNSSTGQASLGRNSTKVDLQVSTENFESNMSWRSSINLNRVLIDDKLAIRVATLFSDEEYTQKPAMKDTQRSYAAITFKPFADKKITLRGNFEDGNIYSNPPNRLGPLENLSTFLNDPRGLVWPKTASNPAGRMTVNSYEALNASNLSAATNNNAYNYLGLDNAGNRLATWGNSTGAPVGKGWALVFDGSEDANGYPTRAFAIQNSGWWINGNQVFDADNNFRGSRNAIFTGPAGFQNMGAAYTSWSDQGLTDYSVYDFRTQLISGGLDNYTHDFDRKNLTLEAISDNGNFGIEVSVDQQNFDRDSYIAIGNPRITFDVNETLPVGPNDLFGATNPNYGRLYIYTGTPTRTYADSKRDTMRGTAFAKFDFREKFDNGLLKWFGRHTATALVDQTTNQASNIGYTLTSEGGDVAFHLNDTNVQGNNRRQKSLIYIGPQQLDAWSNPNFTMQDFQVNSIPGNLAISRMTGDVQVPVAFWNVGNPATQASYNTVTGDEHTDVTNFTNVMRAQNAKLEKTVIDSSAFNLQSFFFNDMLVANLGWRSDDVAYQLNSSPPRDAENVSLVTPDQFNLNDTPVRISAADNFAYGLVLKVPRSWMPQGSTLAFHYGESSNFIPSPDGYDIDGVLTPASEGSSMDYGVTYSMNNKFSVRLNWYTGNSTNLGSDAGSGAGFGYGVMASQTIMNILRDTRKELDDWDWDLNGQFDDPSVDLNNDGVLDQYAANNPLSLTQLHALYNAWDKLATPFMKESTRYEFTPSTSAGANNSTNYIGSDLYYVLKDTIDLDAEGKEIELTYNPTPNWRLMFNATQQSSKISNSYPRLKEFENRFVAALDSIPDTPEHPIEFYRNSGNFLQDSARTDKYATNSLYGKYFGNTYGAQLYYYSKALEGTEDPKVREYRVNFVTNYTFSEGRFKGLNIGGAYRYQSEAALGFELVADPDTGVPYPNPNKPHYDNGNDFIDCWAGYKHKIMNDKVMWKVQLNIRNVFASNVPVAAQFQPDGSMGRVSIPAPRQIMLRNTFEF